MAPTDAGLLSEVKDLGLALFATLVLPIIVLLLDYFIRSKLQTEDRGWWHLVQDSGPDCCILSMGTTGAIFVDPVVSKVSGIKSPLFAVFLVLFLIWMRVSCIRKPVKSGPALVDIQANASGRGDSNLKYGAWSLFAIFFVVLYGYLAQVKHL